MNLNNLKDKNREHRPGPHPSQSRYSIGASLSFSLEQISTAMERALTLTNTPFDLQITICTFLHPYDILALRKVCRQWTS
jgi:hypothetical protein